MIQVAKNGTFLGGFRSDQAPELVDGKTSPNRRDSGVLDNLEINKPQRNQGD